MLPVLGGKVFHSLRQVGQLDQPLLQVLLELGYLRLQCQDSLTGHTQMKAFIVSEEGSRRFYIAGRNKMFLFSSSSFPIMPTDLLQEHRWLSLGAASMVVLSMDSETW